MLDLVVKSNNSGYILVIVWKDRRNLLPLDVTNYSFIFEVFDENRNLVWSAEKNSFDENDEPTKGKFRFRYDANLTSNRGTFVYKITMLGSEILTIAEANIVII